METNEESTQVVEIQPTGMVASSPKIRRILSLDAIPDTPINSKTFGFERDGEKYEIPYTPLTYEQAEQIRASFIPPRPPLRPITSLSTMTTKELGQRALLGLPTHENDEDDPAYRAALVKFNNDVKLEEVRVALGWDVPREEFLKKIRIKFRPGELQSLMEEVDGNAWNISSPLVDRFLQSLSLQTSKEENSET